MNILAQKFSQQLTRHLPDDNADFTFSEGKSEPDLQQAGAVGLVTGVVGAVVGGAIGHQRGVDHYEASTTPTSLSLDWEQPVIKEQVIGQIPKTEVISTGLLERFQLKGWEKKPTRINPQTVDVARQTPVLDESGDMKMTPYSQDYTGYGDPNVEWTSHRIMSPELTGYKRSLTSRYSGQWVHQHNWIPPEEGQLESWKVSYSPKIEKANVGSYQTPEVRFERPPEANKQIMTAAAKGAGIGFATGLVVGVVGSVLHGVLAERT